MYLGRHNPILPEHRQAASRTRIAAALAVAGATALASPAVVAAQEQQGPAPWRVECTGDGKTLECRAIQQLVQIQGNTRQPLATVAVRYAPELKAGQLSLLLPLGLNLTEPVQIKVDNQPPEKQQIQTCNNAGCLVTMTLNDKFLATMRSGTDLKITVQDQAKKPIDLPLPLLGFGIAYDKTK
jgi:invasion protein IalB